MGRRKCEYNSPIWSPNCLNFQAKPILSILAPKFSVAVIITILYCHCTKLSTWFGGTHFTSMVMDLVLPSGDHHEKENCGRHTCVRIESARGELCGTDGATVTASKSVYLGIENAGTSWNERTSNGANVLPSTDSLAVNCYRNLEPHDGMEFDSKENAFSYYKEYAKSIGFSSIIKASRRSRISGKFIDAKFVCSRYGSKREPSTSGAEPVPPADAAGSNPVKRKKGRINRSWSKTDCKACLHVKRRSDGRWVIHTFVQEHNHEIFPDWTSYPPGDRNIDLGKNDADAFHAIRGRTKKTYASTSRHSGVMKKVEKQKNGGTNSSPQSLAFDEGDAQVILEHFLCMQDENPNFFYALDLNQEKHLRNVFWIDAKSRLDCGNFSDVVLFDTTYVTNEYKLQFVPFIGVNHHFQSILLGCGLIADESKSTFIWLMRAWLRALGGQVPKVILTDQGKTLEEVIAEVLPESHHCFCLWHVLSKIQEKLGHVIRKHESFLSKFNKCILRSATNELFEKRWWKVIDRFDLRNDVWIKSLYEDRLRWVPTYMNKIFLAGMSTMQRAESVSSLLDKCILCKTTLKEFLDQYKKLLKEKCQGEANADFETRYEQPGLKSPSPFEKQMSTLYTHTIFKKFQVEVLGVVACHPKKENDDGENDTYRVQDFEVNQEFIVVWNERTSDTSCSCHLFEYNGFLCRHVMIVLQMAGVHNIPSKYVLRRWTKGAKSREKTRQVTLVDSRVQRYNDLCQRVFELGDEGSLSQESYNIVFSVLENFLRTCETVNDANLNESEPCSLPNQGLNDLEVFTDSNNPSKSNGKNIARKEKEGQLGLGEPTMDYPFRSHSAIQPMGQLSTLASIEDGPYLSQPRLHGLGQVYFRPADAQNSFGVQDSLQESTVANTENLCSKNLS
ncbi:protein FAR-RED IMPAIRED RESPONSE 1 isoform X3 [Solanum stenotomum]|uniref:protein FAR-RED IMPAIRED RESPONSE 1 isoform X3 n=1 Tax=Solanum stenotomum TaxID=172797 RepID=UPI0020D067A6|nr:protein FAR-RED IMPAIRED RESPONSE 1 isoform X3 [Solanum stenotomum]